MSYEKANDLLDLAIWMQSSREGVSLNDISERFGILPQVSGGAKKERQK